MTFHAPRTLAVLAAALAVSLVALASGPGLALGTEPAASDPSPALGESTADADRAARTAVESCTTIDRPGVYVLAADVENGGGTPISGTCIEITADDVTLDGEGRSVGGRGVSHTKAVGVVGADNVTVRNLSLTDWHAGVRVTDGSATVRNVNSSGNAYGVRLVDASGSAVENSTLADNLVGVHAGASDVTLAGNDLSGNEISVERDEE